MGGELLLRYVDWIAGKASRQCTRMGAVWRARRDEIRDAAVRVSDGSIVSEINDLNSVRSSAHVFRGIAGGFVVLVWSLGLAVAALSKIGVLPGSVGHNLASRAQGVVFYSVIFGLLGGVFESVRARRKADEIARIRFARAVRATTPATRPMMRAQYHLNLVSQYGATAAFSWSLVATVVIGLGGVILALASSEVRNFAADYVGQIASSFFN